MARSSCMGKDFIRQYTDINYYEAEDGAKFRTEDAAKLYCALLEKFDNNWLELAAVFGMEESDHLIKFLESHYSCGIFTWLVTDFEGDELVYIFRSTIEKAVDYVLNKGGGLTLQHWNKDIFHL